MDISGEQVLVPTTGCLAGCDFPHPPHDEQKGLSEVELGILVEGLQGSQHPPALRLLVFPQDLLDVIVEILLVV